MVFLLGGIFSYIQYSYSSHIYQLPEDYEYKKAPGFSCENLGVLSLLREGSRGKENHCDSSAIARSNHADHVDYIASLERDHQLLGRFDLGRDPHLSRGQSENFVSLFSKDYQFEVVDDAFQPRGRNTERCAIIDAKEDRLEMVDGTILPRRRNSQRLTIGVDAERFFRMLPVKQRVQNLEKERFQQSQRFHDLPPYLIFFCSLAEKILFVRGISMPQNWRKDKVIHFWEFRQEKQKGV
jgi:hypothetical protein